MVNSNRIFSGREKTIVNGTSIPGPIAILPVNFADSTACSLSAPPWASKWAASNSSSVISSAPITPATMAKARHKTVNFFMRNLRISAGVNERCERIESAAQLPTAGLISRPYSTTDLGEPRP
jgi:hypothetical protein